MGNVWGRDAAAAAPSGNHAPQPLARAFQKGDRSRACIIAVVMVKSVASFDHAKISSVSGWISVRRRMGVEVATGMVIVGRSGTLALLNA